MTQPDTEAIRAALQQIGLETNVKRHARLTTGALQALVRLVARLEAAEKVVRAAQEFLNCDEGTDIQFLSEDGIDYYNALDAALAAAAPGETTEPE